MSWKSFRFLALGLISFIVYKIVKDSNDFLGLLAFLLAIVFTLQAIRKA